MQIVNMCRYKLACPRCGSNKNVAWVRYGGPDELSFSMKKAVDRRIVIVKELFESNGSSHYCNHCNIYFGDATEYRNKVRGTGCE